MRKIKKELFEKTGAKEIEVKGKKFIGRGNHIYLESAKDVDIKTLEGEGYAVYLIVSEITEVKEDVEVIEIKEMSKKELVKYAKENHDLTLTEEMKKDDMLKAINNIMQEKGANNGDKGKDK